MFKLYFGIGISEPLLEPTGLKFTCSSLRFSVWFNCWSRFLIPCCCFSRLPVSNLSLRENLWFSFWKWSLELQGFLQMKWSIEMASILGFKMQRIHSWACLTNPFPVVVVELDGFREFPIPSLSSYTLLTCERTLLSLFLGDLWMLFILQSSTWICISIDVVLCDVPLLSELLSERPKGKSWSRCFCNSCKCCTQ